MDEPTPRQTLLRLVARSERIVVLSGAGISTDSGIPDFRGPDGVWTRDPDAERYADIRAYLSDPDLRARSWRWRAAHPALQALPNAGHRALVDLERTGRLLAVVTQNVDGLHVAAGQDPAIVHEVHGSMRDGVCVDCSWRAPIAELLERIRAGEADPRCPDCGGITKAGTVFFGQPLPEEVFAAAVAATEGCDLFLAVGTSLQVFPVAALPEVAARAGATVVVINAEPTGQDGLADLIVRDQVGIVLPEIAAAAVRA